MTNRAVIAAAGFAGTVVRITRRPFRLALRAVPGVAGAALAVAGLWVIAERLWGRGVALGVAMLAGSVFLLWFAAEVNRVPPPRPPE